jgi:hypothetical protein
MVLPNPVTLTSLAKSFITPPLSGQLSGQSTGHLQANTRNKEILSTRAEAMRSKNVLSSPHEMRASPSILF